MKIKTMVIATASLLAINAAAKVQPGQGPALKIGGSLSATAVAVKQNVRYAPASTIQTKGNIMFNVGGESTNGLTYGGATVLNVDRAKENSDRIAEAYVYLTHKDAGTLLLGDTLGVESTMMYSGNDVLGGNGGPGNSDLQKIVNTPVGVSWYTSLAPDEDTASKIVWISPNVSGFQLGLSYTPNTSSYGRTKLTRSFGSSGSLNGGGISSSRYGVNHLAGALSYNAAVNNDLNVGVFLAGTTAKGKTSQKDQTGSFKVHNENQYQIGTLLDYQNWQFGAMYLNKSNSYIRTDRKFSNVKGYNAAIGYNLASHTNVALGYTHTHRKVANGKAQAKITTATVDHVIAPGLVVFTEVDYMNLHTTPGQLALAGTGPTNSLTSSDIYDNYPQSNKSNNATVVMVGTKIRF